MSKTKLDKDGNEIVPDIRESKKKILVHSIRYGILTTTTLQGRPALFIILADKRNKTAKKLSIKKINKRIDKDCASHLVVIEGEKPDTPTMDFNLASLLLRKGMTAVFFTNGQEETKKFPFASDQIFICCNVVHKTVTDDIALHAQMFLYEIHDKVKLNKDGLPVVSYRPTNMMRVMITPSNTYNEQDVSRTVSVCKQYGYYMTYPWSTHIGDI